MFNTPVIHSPSALLEKSTHRPFPLPQNRPWVMAQTWQRLLFAHWPVPIDVIRPMIPDSLTIDTYEGEAWISVVPFLMTGVRLRGLPPVPGTGTFPELNVRTYIIHEGKPGVWFFSLEAANPLAVWVARTTYNLPYYNAKMNIKADDTGKISYNSLRTHRNAKSAMFSGHYRPIAPVQDYAEDSLDRWLSDRYVLYSADRHGKTFIGHITHVPWPLQPAEAEFETNTMAESSGITLPDTPPLLHYVHQLDILAWAIQPI